jgi:L-ascorbate metabolism protein UlaG (beta-lactamase superfamily)
MEPKLYLKPNVVSEPLILGWYAWPHLLAPHTAACNIVDRHLRIMESYVENPDSHEEAVRSPAFAGGAFMNLPQRRLAEVSSLIEHTRREAADLIALRHDIRSADLMLQELGTGGPLESLYERLPARLRGRVELTYDLNCHPSIRFIEPLFYRAFDQSRHHQMMLRERESEKRPFLLSTPRIAERDDLTLHMPFADPRWDDLYRMTHEARQFGEVAELLDLSGEQRARLHSLCRERGPQGEAGGRFSGEGVRIKYFGHACVLLETRRTNVLIDPFIAYDQPSSVPKFTYADLPVRLDHVLLTHAHQDHAVLESLIQLRHRIGTIIVPNSHGGSLADPSLRLALEHLGFTQVVELSEFARVEVDGGAVTMLPFLGEHGDLGVLAKGAFHVRMEGRTFLFVADSNNLDDMLYEYIVEAVGPVNNLFVGMECVGSPLSWLYGPLRTRPLGRSHDMSRRLNGSDASKALRLARTVKARHAFVYAMGQEPWQEYLMGMNADPNSVQAREVREFLASFPRDGRTARSLYGCQMWVDRDEEDLEILV